MPSSLKLLFPRLRYSVFFQMLIIWWFKHIPMELFKFYKQNTTKSWLGRTHQIKRVNTYEEETGKNRRRVG